MKNYFLISILIVTFRMLDLYTTKLAIVDFANQEQNLLVKIFKLNMNDFFIVEIGIALLLCLCYIYSYKNYSVFNFKQDTFVKYINFFFFTKTRSNVFDWLFKISFRKAIILFGTIIPVFIISTSIIYSLNNYWVYLVISSNSTAIKYYKLFDQYYFFDFIIFVIPILLLVYLLFDMLRKNFLKNNLQIQHN